MLRATWGLENALSTEYIRNLPDEGLSYLCDDLFATEFLSVSTNKFKWICAFLLSKLSTSLRILNERIISSSS